MAQYKKFALAMAFLTLAFALPLGRLVWFSIHDDLHSYIPLMPFVCVYLAWIFKSELPVRSSPAINSGMVLLVCGLAAALSYFLLARPASLAGLENSLSLSTLAWVLLVAAAGCWFLGGAAMRALAFPFGLMIFMVPFPVPVRDAIESGLQVGSAVVAEWMYTLAGTPVIRDDIFFRLPGFSLQVAPECSGIHSTWVLLITSLVAGRMILLRPWKRAVLCLAVIPLALLRNGFRVFVIGELCVHISPRMIDSPIHHKGGPIFFVLSLIPFFLLLYFLRKGETADTVRQSNKSE